MLAQTYGSDSGAALLGIIIALALIAPQIYLIYAIIATRQDVRAIRTFLVGGGGGQQQVWQSHGQAQTVTLPPAGPSYKVVLRGAGERPEDVEQLLMWQFGFVRSAANEAVRHPGQLILATEDWTRAQHAQASIQQAGGQVEIQESHSDASAEEGSGPSATPF